MNEETEPKILRIFPGTSDSKSLVVDMDEVPREYRTINEVLRYVLTPDWLDPKAENTGKSGRRAARSIVEEMNSRYGYSMTANEDRISGNERVENLYKRAKDEHQRMFRIVELVVASDQQGGQLESIL